MPFSILRSLPVTGSWISTRGRSDGSRDSITTLRERPVRASTCSSYVTFGIRSAKRTLPVSSVRIGMVNGSHSTSTDSLGLMSPSFTLSVAPYIRWWRSRSRPVASTITISPWRFITTRVPSLRAMVSTLSSFTRPSTRLVSAAAATAFCAVPPMWKVRIVSCVPGSPIDCAAMMPTASPLFTM
jgi:hypothetical protein